MFRGNTDGSDVLFTGTKKGVVEEKENLGQPRDDAPGACQCVFLAGAEIFTSPAVFKCR